MFAEAAAGPSAGWWVRVGVVGRSGRAVLTEAARRLRDATEGLRSGDGTRRPHQMSVTSVTPVTHLVRRGVEPSPAKLLRLHPHCFSCLGARG
jgi:hypothetical protein